ncbi:hypothetical protein [Goodfellowiella coeruleoviolacea]|uniref:Uncharacterized protein n=1 Tax=Goodfellowiella coeruleoviolacea TaxID=334858 RepID=A0AAE3GD24_9PSEU|nr:hypothetical protein [Goodfellowiella coeruleoviolacea]MCP2165558.1 hypothetical protein [Goodfellowiella coeruleoviolacea]
MDENEISAGLRGLTLPEPALGFDPDEVATRAAKRLRGRRAALGTGLAVLALGVASVAVVGNSTGADQHAPAGSGQAPAGQPTGLSTSASPTTATPLERNQAHLREVLPTVLPEATDISVGAFDDGYGGVFTSVVTFTDSAGPGTFNVTVTTAAGGAEHMTPLAERCGPNEADQGEGGLKPNRRPDGSPLRCDKIPQPGGGTLVLKETAEGAPAAPIRVNALHASYYRPDGSVVNIWNGDSTPPPNPVSRARIALTEQQLTAVATDPQLRLP